MIEKTAVVTGAAGYIGSVLCKTLKEQNYYVIGIDIDKPPTAAAEKYYNVFHRMDFINITDMIPEDATVFHLAASSLLGPSATDPMLYFDNNTAKTTKLIKSLKPSNRFIFASTAAVYPLSHHESSYFQETDYLKPPNNYGLSKLMTEQMLNAVYETLNLRAVSFRFFNVIGAYDDVGQKLGTPHIISQLCQAYMNKTPFTVYGINHKTKDGSCVRDYLHVRDVAAALIRADEYLAGNCAINLNVPCHNKYNLGTRHGHSVWDIVASFSKVVGKPYVEIGQKRIGDPPHLVSNPELFIKHTGFEYKHSDNLDEMILSAWRYYKNDVRL
jgi:UDP-glucose 4-epimerase